MDRAKMNRTVKKLIELIPWIYLAAYSFVISGMARALQDTQRGELIPDPIYTNAELTMMLSFWVTFSIIAAGYFLIRYACKIAVKNTTTDKIKELNDTNRALRTDLEIANDNIRRLRESVLSLTGRVFSLEKSSDNETETGIETN